MEGYEDGFLEFEHSGLEPCEHVDDGDDDDGKDDNDDDDNYDRKFERISFSPH